MATILGAPSAVGSGAKVTSFKPSEAFAAAANDAFERHRAKIAGAIPDADIHHVGGTSLPGALTKGDLDVQVRVIPERFADAVSRLAELYAKSRTYAWDDGFAAFEAPADGLADPTAISVVATGSAYDWCGAALWELLAADPALLRRYNALKTRHHGGSWEAYEEEKNVFFRELLADHGPSRPPDADE
jgi:GrpB-like predicted nucleotidyltransferase (UPF0157 family)